MARIALSAVPETGARSVEVEGRRVLLCRAAGAIHAVDDVCPHQALSLDGGRVRGTSLFCPHHGARFSLEDGRSLSPLTQKGLTLFETRIDGDELEISF